MRIISNLLSILLILSGIMIMLLELEIQPFTVGIAYIFWGINTYMINNKK